MSLRTATALLLIAAACTVTSCTGNDQDFSFTSLRNDGDATVSFDIDLSDTACVYSICLISRFKKNTQCDDVTFLVRLTSPSGKSGSERITLPSDYRTVRDYVRNKPDDNRIKATSAPGYYDISWTYRTNIIPQEYGMWKMDISVAEQDTGIIGLGTAASRTPLAEQ